MSSLDPTALAQELIDARSTVQPISLPPSARTADFDLAAGYAVEAEIARARKASGHNTVGYKVGFANKALWRVLGLETLVWARMYDDTMRHAQDGAATVSIGSLVSPKIEPEIIFRMKRPLEASDVEPAAVLDAVEWIALGFEIIDCPYPDWKFQPADFVAAFGLHAALVVGEPRRIDPALIPDLVDQLPRFKVRLLKDGHLVEEGSGRNVLRSPVLCLRELASAMSRRGETSLLAGDLVSSGTLTESSPIRPGETWMAALDGLDLKGPTVRTEA